MHNKGGLKVLEKLWATSVILMYLGVGVILGAAIMLIKVNEDLAFGIGGTLALIAVGIYAYCLVYSSKTKRKTKDNNCPE